MKVKKLEWENIDKNRILVSRNKLYSINVFSSGKVIVSSAFQSAFYRENIEQAKKACQYHFDAFIKAQIENEVKDFDPTLLGFKKNSLKSDDSIDIYKKKDLILEFDKIGKEWLLRSKKYRQVFFFDDIKIPSHEFGVQLISQFLGKNNG